MGKLTISMAIFNSYVKLPEGMFFVGSSSDSWTNWNPPHIETVVEACVIGWQTKSSQFKIAWYTFSIWGYLGFDYQLSSSIFLGLGLWLQLDSIWRPWSSLIVWGFRMCQCAMMCDGPEVEIWGIPTWIFRPSSPSTAVSSSWMRPELATTSASHVAAPGIGDMPKLGDTHGRRRKWKTLRMRGFNHNNWVWYPAFIIENGHRKSGFSH